MRRQLALIAVLCCVALLGGAGDAAAADCPGGDLPPLAQNVAQMTSATLCLLNQQRAANGLRALTEQSQLDAASLGHSQDMVRRQYFAHDTLGGGDFVDRLIAAGYALTENDGWALGENLAWGSNELSTPANIVDALMHSPGHRANILDRGYSEIGIGIVIGAPVPDTPNAATYTTDFGSGQTAKTTALPVSAKKKPKKAAKKATRRSSCTRHAKASHHARRAKSCAASAKRRHH